jgi:hypothetical protein
VTLNLRTSGKVAGFLAHAASSKQDLKSEFGQPFDHVGTLGGLEEYTAQTRPMRKIRFAWRELGTQEFSPTERKDLARVTRLALRRDYKLFKDFVARYPSRTGEGDRGLQSVALAMINGSRKIGLGPEVRELRELADWVMKDIFDEAEGRLGPRLLDRGVMRRGPYFYQRLEAAVPAAFAVGYRLDGTRDAVVRDTLRTIGEWKHLSTLEGSKLAELAKIMGYDAP